MLQDEVTNFQPRAADLDYPGKLQQRQDQEATEQTSLTAHQNGDGPPAAVPQQNTDSQVPPNCHLLLCLQVSGIEAHSLKST